MENNSPFRFVKNIQEGTPLTSEEMKEFQPYLINRLYYYSGLENYANLMNCLWSLPKEFQYRLFCLLFHGFTPHGWIKSTKNKETDGLEVEYLKRKYQVSTKVAREYAELLTPAEVKEIKKRFS
jgi:hypothetical protein